MGQAAKNGDYAATVVMIGKDKDGGELESRFPIVFRVRGMAPAEPIDPAFENVSSSLVAGENGAITLTLRNSGKTSEMRDIVLKATDETGQILPEYSDRLKCGSLMPGEEIDVSIPVSVLPTADITLHSVALSLSCDGPDGEAFYTEAFTLPVKQAIRLEQGGIQMAQTAIQGEMTSMTLPLMNLGRGTLCNVMAMLQMTGITDRQSVLVGNIVPGETAQARMSISLPKTALGEYSGTVIVTCEDEWENGESFELPVSCTVNEPVWSEAIEKALA